MSRKVKTTKPISGAKSGKGTSVPSNSSDNTTSFAAELTQQIIDLAPDPIISIDKFRTIVLFNKGAEKIFGYTAREALGESLDLLFPASARSDNLEPIISFCEEAEKSECANDKFELTGIRKSGEEFPAKAAISKNRTKEKLLFTIVLRDSIEQDIGEKPLSQSEAKYRDLFEDAPVAYLSVNIDGIIISANKCAFDMLTVGSENLIGREIFDFHGGDTGSQKASEKVFERFKGGELIENEELKRVKSDGSEFWVSLSIKPIFDQDGKVIASRSTMIDITDRKHAEEALLLTQFSITHTSDSVFWVKPDGSIAYVNDAACNTLGYLREELLRMRMQDIEVDFDDQKLNERWKRIRTDKVFTLETEHRKKDGAVFPVEFQINFMNFEGQEYNFVFARDITEKRKTEHALRLTQFSIDRSADLAFWINQTGKLVYVNDAACMTLGYSRKKLLNLKITDIDNSISEESWPKRWNEIKSKSAISFESAIQGSGEWSLPVEIHANYLNFEQHEYIFAFVKDISDRKVSQKSRRELQDKLERAEKMESLGLLAGGVAHDLNNMLGPLVGYPDLILRKLPEDSPIRNQIIKMGKAAADAADVIQDLLALARRGRYEIEPLDLNTVIRDYLESPGFEALRDKRPDVTLVNDFDESLGRIKGSAPHLAKVIMNIVVNAYDAMTDGGTLSIRTESGKFEALLGGYENVEPGEYALVRIKDTGAGIDPEYLKNIFDPYFSRKKMGQKSGSGLGLAVVYGIVKDHKGYYDIFSELTKGAEFVLYFPLTESESEDIQSRTRKLLVGNATQRLIIGKQRILVVDDNRSQREMVFEMLSSLGYRVDLAASGQEAVEKVKKLPADILVMDMILEDGFDGLDTFREIKKIYPDQKAIIVSGYSATDRVEEMQRLGAGSYVRKPYTRKTLARAVRTELDKSATPGKSLPTTSS